MELDFRNLKKFWNTMDIFLRKISGTSHRQFINILGDVITIKQENPLKAVYVKDDLTTGSITLYKYRCFLVILKLKVFPCSGYSRVPGRINVSNHHRVVGSLCDLKLSVKCCIIQGRWYLAAGIYWIAVYMTYSNDTWRTLYILFFF